INAASGEMVLYLNGEAQGTVTTAASAFTSLHVGRREATGSHYLVGAMDNVRVYDRPLTADEIGMLVNNEDVAEGLLVGFNLDETEGLVAASSFDGGTEGALTGFEPVGEFWTAGNTDGGLNTEGGGYPEITSTTWAVWVNLNGQPSFGPAISAAFEGAGAGHSLGFHSGATAFNPRILWNHAQGHLSLLSDDPVNPGEWNHLALTYDAQSEELILYVNGEEKKRGAVGTTPYSTINLARRASSASHPLNAILDDVRIYDRVLSALDIQSLVGRRVTGPPAITAHPQSVELFEGDSAAFSVEAEGGAPFTYQWSKNGRPLPGETFSEFTITDSIADAAGVYQVTVSNGEGSATSNEAVVTVITLPTENIGLLAEYLFDETQGLIAVDSSGNGNDGVLEGYADETGHWTSGRIAGGLTIADGGYVDIQFADLIQSTTWSAWVRLESDNDFQTAISAAFPGATAGHIMGFRSSPAPNIPRVLWNHGAVHTSVQAPEQIPLGEWFYYAITVDHATGELTLYVNGEIAAQGNTETTPFNHVNIGRRAASLNFPMGGAIDSVRIYDVVLSPDEILEIFLAAPTPVQDPVVISSIQTNDDGQVELVVDTPEPGFEHVVQSKAEVDAAAWQDRDDIALVAGEPGQLTATFDAPADPTEFYRVAMLAPEAIYFEDFEDGGAGWEHAGTGDNWELGTPVNGPAAAFSGSNAFGTDLDGPVAEFADAILRSPVIDLTAATSATLTFYEFLKIDVNPVFQKTVVSVLDASTLETLEELGTKSGSVSSWKQRSLDLTTDSLGKSVILEFRILTDNFNLLDGWYLDDVAITP
ncbi:MAG TPA: hypothetical protein EYQ50_25605, partial [Verrucomicrobiales bacterium]|nr:hypothetical protein [Verrucomicrobiales bacterium]